MASAGAVIAQSDPLPDSPEKEMVMQACTQCHGMDVVLNQRRTPDEWNDVVARMVGDGASMSDEEYKTVVSYLSSSFGPDPAASAADPAAPAADPAASAAASAAAPAADPAAPAAPAADPAAPAADPAAH